MGPNGFGFIGSIVMLVVMAFWTMPDKPWTYLDAHGGFTVLVGTALITLISVPFQEAKSFFSLIKVVCTKEHDDRIEIIDQLVEMAYKARVDMGQLAPYAEKAKDYFLRDAVQLLVQGLDAENMMKILRRRLEVQKERENGNAKMFKNLGKYPPACGLLGTVMGMIALLGTLGQEGAGEKIGPAMSVALAATLYGVIVANMLIMPVADNLMSRTQKSIAKREMIVEGIILIKQKTSPILVKEMLLSHLPPAMRAKVSSEGGSNRSPQAAA